MVSSLFAWGDSIPKPDVKTLSEGSTTAGYVTIICADGYKYLYVDGGNDGGLTQMFEESKYMDAGAKPAQPIKCK